MSRPITVHLNGFRSTVRGWEAAGYVRSITGRHPRWIAMERAYAVTERTAGEVIALAESRGRQVIVTRADVATEVE